jgi:hypothetical protein
LHGHFHNNYTNETDKNYWMTYRDMFKCTAFLVDILQKNTFCNLLKYCPLLVTLLSVPYVDFYIRLKSKSINAKTFFLITQYGIMTWNKHFSAFSFCLKSNSNFSEFKFLAELIWNGSFMVSALWIW